MRLGLLGTTVATQHDDFDDVEGQGAIPIVHDQDISIAESRLAIDIGLTKRFAAFAMVPVRVVSTRIRYLDGSGERVDLVTASPHHRNETLTGIADPMVLGALTLEPFTVRFGTTIPLGRTEDDPFAMPEVPHQHIQMGTGTFNPVLSIEGGYSWDRWRVSAFGFTQQVLYTNDKGHKAGDRYAAGVAVRRALRRWSVRGGVEVQAETFEAWNGTRYTEEGNQGRIDAMFAAGTTWSVTPEVSVELALKVPFINYVNNGQLRMPALLELGVSYAFGKRAGRPAEEEDHDHEGEHEHEHEGHAHGDGDHGDEHHDDEHALDTTGADVVDLGHGGSRVDLIPVPGKITIFDFWAEWCVPCKTLEPILVELAKANPNGVALRRIDVIDWESQVVAQHLTPRGFDLPHVKIYDANGKLVFEESSGPGKLQTMIGTIRALVGGPVQESPPATAVSITVTERGFEPNAVTVPRGVPVTLRIERKVKKTCATEINFINAGDKVRHELPLDKPIEFTVTFTTAGAIQYACDMDMISGTINVR